METLASTVQKMIEMVEGDEAYALAGVTYYTHDLSEAECTHLAESEVVAECTPYHDRDEVSAYVDKVEYVFVFDFPVWLTHHLSRHRLSNRLEWTSRNTAVRHAPPRIATMLEAGEWAEAIGWLECIAQETRRIVESVAQLAAAADLEPLAQIWRLQAWEVELAYRQALEECE